MNLAGPAPRCTRRPEPTRSLTARRRRSTRPVPITEMGVEGQKSVYLVHIGAIVAAAVLLGSLIVRLCLVTALGPTAWWPSLGPP